MTDEESMPSHYQHAPEAQWSVGDLRQSLVDVPDDLPIKVLVPGEPLGDIRAHMVVCDGQMEDADSAGLVPDRGAPRQWFEIYIDFAPGIYRLDSGDIFDG